MGIANIARTSDETPPLTSLEIRPGVRFPDWSTVRSAYVRRVVEDIVVAFGLDRCWRNLGADEDVIRRVILASYLEAGHPPALLALAKRTGFARWQVRALLDSLSERDLVVLDNAGAAILGAHPFTEHETELRVHIGDHVVHVTCAIDALGVGRMYHRDVTIESCCRATRTPIRITTAGRGTRVETVTPTSAVVWSGTRTSRRCGADAVCPVIALFASERALEAWRRSERPEKRGHRLSLDEAMQAGTAIVAPLFGEPAA